MTEKKHIGSISLSNKMRRAIWNIVSLILFRPFVTPLFSRWRILLLRLFGADIAWDAQVYASARIWAPWLLRLGHEACLGPHTICYNQDWVVIEDNATVSQYSYLCTAGHDTQIDNNAKTGLIVAPIIVHSKAWIGTRAFIGMGTEIGEGAIVGATASVYKDVEPWTVVGGNPAQVIKKREMKP